MFETVIGLEIHAELSTETKAFCSCPVGFGGEPNTRCCPVCMGFPGALPVLNKKMVEYAIKMGLATNCSIAHVSEHTRKNYFYPDLPKGYQISQGDMPLCKNGYLVVKGKRIRINRIHIEEDAGKLIHTNEGTLIDFNRAGVPLIEIVTEPDFRKSEEVKAFLDEIRSILLCLGISDCKMQEGSLRCDVNVSVRQAGTTEYGERCEMKNINSFSAAMRSIKYEEKRQRDILTDGGIIHRETRRWSDEKGESILLRDKESEADYRYFKDPDLPPIYITDEEIEKLEREMPELPGEKRKRYIEAYGLNENDTELIVRERAFAELFEEAVSFGGDAKAVINWIVGDVSKIVNRDGLDVNALPFGGKELYELLRLVEDNIVSVTVAKDVLEYMFCDGEAPEDIVKEKGFTQISNEAELESVVKKVLRENQKSIADYKNGKTNALGYLIGQCMRETDNKANPRMISSILRKCMEADI